jgi:hypothetical protein
MKSGLEEVCREKKKAVEAHVRDLKAKDTQIATIRELNAQKIANLRQHL